MTKKRLLCGLLAALLTIAAIWFGVSLHMAYQSLAVQFGPDITYEDDTLKVLPGGVRCLQRICTPMESLAVMLFYRGKQIETAASDMFRPDSPYDTRYNVKYYRVRGLDNLSAIIVKSDDCPTRIIVPTDFSSYCAYDFYDQRYPNSHEGNCNHEAIFTSILSDFYGCRKASDIAAIRVEAIPRSNLNTDHMELGDRIALTKKIEAFTPIRITDRDTIDAVWTTLLEGTYLNSSRGISSPSPSIQPICLANLQESIEYHYNEDETKEAEAIRLYIILEFHDGSIFRFNHKTCDNTFWFSFEMYGSRSKESRVPSSENLVFQPPQTEELHTLLGIEQ